MCIFHKHHLPNEEIIKLQEDISKVNAEKSETGADVSGLKNQIEEKWHYLEDLQGENPMVHAHVSPSVVAQIISEWTGIPAGNMVADEATTLLQLEDLINERVKGQSWGMAEIADSLRSARTGLKNEEAPLGVFLLSGPSGVGKTETALAISDLLFGGSESVTTINMSEYQDSMSVTQLKGVSAGFVGYGEGGVLTEAVRKRPYTVVILDEVEKAHKDVLNMFYQVFDKGILRDGEGRAVNFRNTVIVMTSNLGADTIMQLAFSGKALDYEEFKKAVLPELTAHFQPALLARCKALPFMPLGSDVIQDITILKLGKVQKRLMEKHQLNFKVDASAIQRIVADCTVVQSGARNIDTIIEQQILPTISQRILENMAEDTADTELIIKANEDGDYVYDYGDGQEIVVASLSAAPAQSEQVEEATSESPENSAPESDEEASKEEPAD